MRTDKRRWKRQEQLRAALGIRAGTLRNGSTKSTIFGKVDAQWKPAEGIDLGHSTQHMERLFGVEPWGRSLAGLTPRRRAWQVRCICDSECESS
jgi:hypothetical protein